MLTTTIAAHYYDDVTGELEKAAQAYQEWTASYPQDYRAHLNLGNAYFEQGQCEKAAEECRESLRLEPGSGAPYVDLANSLLALQRFDEARQTLQQARKLENFIAHNALYALAFLRGDSSGMAEQQQWFAGKPEEDIALSLTYSRETHLHLQPARRMRNEIQNYHSTYRNDTICRAGDHCNSSAVAN